MIEKYSFIVDGETVSFADLKNNYGLYLRNIEQSATVSWNIATSKNPFMDGEQVNNRTANSREMTIEFGYTMTVDPEEASAFLFRYFNASSGNVTVKKETVGNSPVTKWIDGTIREINQLVFSDEPVLQIVLLTSPFWYGELISGELYELGTIVQDFPDLIFSVDISTNDFGSQFNIPWNFSVSINRNDSEKTHQFIGGYGVMLREDIPIVYENASSEQIKKIDYNFIDIGGTNKVTKTITKGDGSKTVTNMINNLIPIGYAEFKKLPIKGTINLTAGEGIYAPEGAPKFNWVNAILSLRPLYIR